MFVLKKIYELRSEALLIQIFVKLSTAIFTSSDLSSAALTVAIAFCRQKLRGLKM